MICGCHDYVVNQLLKGFVFQLFVMSVLAKELCTFILIVFSLWVIDHIMKPE